MTPEEKKKRFVERMVAGRQRRKALEEENARLRKLAGQKAPTEELLPLSPALSVSAQQDEAGGSSAVNPPHAASDLLPQTPQPAKQQCVFCGVEFGSQLLEEHMLRVHGEMPMVLRPDQRQELPPGTIVAPEGGGLPFKVRWTRGRLERDCNNWDGNPDHMHWEEIDPGDIGMPTTVVTWNSVSYRLIAGQVNRVPNVIAGQLRQSRRETAYAFRNATSVGSVLPTSEEAEVS